MYSAKPILWYDVDRIMPGVIEELLKDGYYNRTIEVKDGRVSEAIGYMPPVYPTPDQLFRWKPTNV